MLSVIKLIQKEWKKPQTVIMIEKIRKALSFKVSLPFILKHTSSGKQVGK